MSCLGAPTLLQCEPLVSTFYLGHPPPKEPLSKRFSALATIECKDLLLLLPGVWLNDAVIEAATSLMVANATGAWVVFNSLEWFFREGEKDAHKRTEV